jgi:7-keto-8-aminopelargonate synthetase-like enzyme
LAAPLQQVKRTFVREGGRHWVYFAGCDYFRFSSHPAVLEALRLGLDEFGLNVAASRRTTGNHLLYGQLEQALEEFFGQGRAVLFSNGYMANLGAAQGLQGDFTHALIDERAHSSLFDAARLLDCPLLKFTHRDAAAAAALARKCGRNSRLVLLTDGLFAHSGSTAPLAEYVRRLPSSAQLWVDDAHAAGVLGRRGRGTAEHEGIEPRRWIQTVTLSKAFGAYGGAVLGSARLRNRIVQRSRLFAGNTPVPLPLAAASLAALRLLKGDRRLRRHLLFNASYVRAALREQGWPVSDGPGPIIAIHPANARAALRLCRRLRAAGIHPPLINYLGGPGPGYFRFAISSEHSLQQLDSLVRAMNVES